MTDKEREELATALLLVLGDRDPEDIARAIITAMGDRYWHLDDALREANHIVVVDTMSAAYVRERLAEGFYNENGEDTPEQLKGTVSDADIYTVLMNAHIPYAIYETMGCVLDDVIGEFRKQGLIENIPTEVTQDVSHQTC